MTPDRPGIWTLAPADGGPLEFIPLDWSAPGRLVVVGDPVTTAADLTARGTWQGLEDSLPPPGLPE